MTILVDMDDTIENLLHTWVEYLDNRHNLEVKCEDISCWDMCKSFPTLTRDEVFMPLREPELWEGVKPLPGAVEGVKKLMNDGHDVFIITASHPDTVALKMNKVLFKYFPFIDYKKIIITSQKSMIKGDVLIDDAPHNLVGGDYIGLLKSMPHNKWFDAESSNLIRVKDWDDIYRVICNLSQSNQKDRGE